MSDNFKTQLKRVKGLGSAHSGAKNWLMLRISAVALVPLTIWLVLAMLCLARKDYSQIIIWLKNPLNTLLLLILLPITFYHAYAGLKEVIEDYVHKEFWKFLLLISLKLFFVFLTAADIFAALYIDFKL